MDEEEGFRSPSGPKSLAPLSVEELEAYIEKLKAEIERVKGELERKRAHLQSAASIFTRRNEE
ncbi:MAG TPA: DUF1192 domain-containing protein [Dongiaceae bacterium]|jgi:uncharacterized small protein (DUF1192 family)|nr:DUF1192 domain-containing protein [Dongiaceae bacterium]